MLSSSREQDVVFGQNTILMHYYQPSTRRVPLQREHGTVYHQRLGHAPHFEIVCLYSSVIRLTWRCPLWRSGDVCVVCVCVSFRCCRFCIAPPLLCDGRTIILTFLSRVSILTLDIDIANLSFCPSVCPSVTFR